MTVKIVGFFSMCGILSKLCSFRECNRQHLLSILLPRSGRQRAKVTAEMARGALQRARGITCRGKVALY